MGTILQAIPDNDDSFLSLLGIVPHRIVPGDGYRPSPPILTVHQVEQLLDSGIRKGLFTVDESEELHAQAVAVGMPVDTRALIARALEYEVGGDLGELSFRVCTCENCTALPGLPRGRYFRGDIMLTESIITMVDAFEAAQELTSIGSFTPWQAILLIRQAASSGIPTDSKHVQEILDGIPYEKKLAYLQRQEEFESEQEALNIVGIFGIEIDGPVEVFTVSGGSIVHRYDEPPDDMIDIVLNFFRRRSRIVLNFFRRHFGRRGR